MTSNDLTLSELCCKRNPLPRRDDVATRQDVFPGARLFRVGYGKLPDVEILDVVSLHTNSAGIECIRTRSGYEYSLADLGIVPYGEKNWNTHFVTFPNKPEVRKSVTEWLEGQGDGARESARLLKRMFRVNF